MAIHGALSPLRAPLTGLAFLAFEAGWPPLALRPGRSSRAALRLISRLLSSIEPNLKLAKPFFETGTALNVIETALEITDLYLFVGQKFGENVVQKTVALLPFRREYVVG
jgi:hypothetical protein